MTIEQFRLLTEEQQAIEINNGICVAGRDEGELKVLLFHLYCFYVEIYYHPGKRLIIDYKAIEQADKYLKPVGLALVAQ